MSAQPPNILLVMADQLAASALPFYGHPVVQTPHLSALAEEGVVFDNAYCNSPLCCPSRASMLTGQLPSKNGAYDNAGLLSADTPTFAHYLRRAGYATSLAGKMHFVGPDQLHGYEERLTTDIYPSDFGWTPDWERRERFPWYHNLLSVVQAGVCETSNQLDFDEEVSFRAVRKVYDLARTEDPRPFFLTVSFTHPHDPFAITPEYWNRYAHDEIDMPAIPPLPYAELDPHSQRLYEACALGDYAQTEARVKSARHAYYGMISYVDDKVGQLLEALERTGQRENTLIIFTADHGEMLGERGLWYKMSFFENSARIPLLVHAPQQFSPKRVAESVSLVDMLPTLTELAGGITDYTSPLDGHSLLPLLEGTSQPERTVYGEMLGEGAVAPLLMIRRGRYKYIYSAPDPEQLYDVETDPLEQNNLAQSSEFETLRQSFYDEVMQRWDIDTLHEEVLESQQRRRFIFETLQQGVNTHWDFQPFRDATERFMRGHLDLDVLERTVRYPTPGVPKPDGPNVVLRSVKTPD